MQLSLKNLKVGEAAFIVDIKTDICLKRRLQDLGVLKNSKIEVLHSSPSGNPRAYLIKGCVIVLRNCDAEKITVEKEGGNRDW